MAEVAVLGTGSWGTALAVLLAKKGIEVNMWGRNEDKVKTIMQVRENKQYLPGIALPPEITVSSNMESIVENTRYIVLSVPSHTIRDICKEIRPLVKTNTIIINTAKGIETETQKRLSQVIEEELADNKVAISVLSGPSHAEEVGKEIPTAVVVGADLKETAEEVQDLFMSPNFRVYTNPDLVGIEIGAALKNVIAIGTGITEGLGYGDNSKAALITRGAAEIARLGVAAGANPLTFAGLTGIGDLIVTCTSMHSRNRRAGIKIGQGYTLEETLANVGMVVEGVKATRAACALSQHYGVSMPICHETFEVLFNGKNPREAVVDLMMRQKKHEAEEVVFDSDW